MNKFIQDIGKVPVLRVLFPFLVGIIIGLNFSERNLNVWLFSVALIVFSVLMAIWFLKRGYSNQKVMLLSPGLSLLFAFIGVLYSMELREKAPDIVCEGKALVSARLLSDIEEKGNNYVVSIETDQWIINDTLLQNKQKMMLYIKKDSLVPEMFAGEKWIFGGEVRRIKNNGNPGEFDYAAYMHRKGFWNILFVSPKIYTRLSEPPVRSLKYLPDRIARNIRNGWNMDDPDIAVLNAITLGDKHMLTREIRSAFSGSGAMHLLAVSGLHVGMIWWILDKIIRLPRRKRLFRIVKVLIILGILWVYAGITGFSDSVTRSVTMFSLVSIATSFSRSSNIYNTLFLSAFILLALKPSRIVEPGFQLSYLAVFGIVSLHPLLSKVFSIRSKPGKRISDLIFVSIAAQLATLPLSLLYFHIFPVYFILTNLVAIPIVSLILALFVLFSPLFLMNIHPEFFSMILLKMTHLLNVIVNSISSLPGAVIENVSLKPAISLLLLVFIFSSAAFFIYKRVSWIIISVALLASAFFISSYTHQKDRDLESITIYNFHDCTVISCAGSGEEETYLLYQNEKPGPYTYDYLSMAGTYNKKEGNSRMIEIETNSDSLHTCNRIFEICDGAWALSYAGQKILICGDCKGNNLQQMLDEIQWDLVVFRAGLPYLSEQHINLLERTLVLADGTFRNFELNRLKNALPNIYATSVNGAFLLNIPDTVIVDTQRQ